MALAFIWLRPYFKTYLKHSIALETSLKLKTIKNADLLIALSNQQLYRKFKKKFKYRTVYYIAIKTLTSGVLK